MKTEDANKIISEFMGDKDTRPDGYYKPLPNYTSSLDALVPVWEKLGIDNLEFKHIAYDQAGWFLDINAILDTRKDNTLNLSIQEAAAIATACCIQGLKS